MRSLVMTALVGGHIALLAQPAAGAEIIEERVAGSARQGAFAGARFRVPLGGAEAGRVRAGLALAPTAEVRRPDGSGRTRFGAGLELGVSGSERAALSFGGRPVGQRMLTPSGQAPDKDRAGVSTLGYVAIGVGVVVVVLAALLVTCQETNCLNSE